MKKRIPILLPVTFLVLSLLACKLVQGATPAPEATQPAQVTIDASAAPESPVPDNSAAGTLAPELTPPPPPENVYAPVFASYPEVKVELPSTFAGGYTLPVDLASVQGLDLVELSAGQLDLLARNGFVVAAPLPGKYREFYQVYESQRYSLDQPVFATTDAVLHVYHLIFDKMLRDLEREHFLTDVEALTSVMLSAADAQYQALQATDLAEPARRNVGFFAVAARLLELDDPTPAYVQDLVEAELGLLTAQGGAQVSPLWDRSDLPDNQKLIEDYSQYIPRGHYTRSDDLKRYFKTMMWYGRLTYRLRDDFETRRALLLVKALRSAQAADGRSAVQLWQNIYEPTVFIVGKADDLSYFEYGALSDQIFGADSGPEVFVDEALFAQFRQAAKNLPPPQVNSMWVWITEDKEEATQGFRFMGQRFTLDQYVFGQMIWREVGTLDKPRGMPMALDFFAAMGSDEALGLIRELGEDQYENFDTQMSKVSQEVASLGLDSWTQNLYWSWLYAFQPLLTPKDARYPAFMQTQAWIRKDLNAALGSWTELKHDTILYSKQVMAEMGGGAPDEPPHGYVEPNPELYARLLALAQMTQTGLEERGLLTELTRSNLTNLIDQLMFMQTVSEKELRGETLSDDDYWRIQYFGGYLENLTLAASDCDEADLNYCRDLSDQKAALVADVATGIGPQGDLLALEEGVGQPAEIYVVLPDQPWRVAVGAVFTYYEFSVAPDERMTDETWQAKVESGTTPPLPAWTSLFLTP